MSFSARWMEDCARPCSPFWIFEKKKPALDCQHIVNTALAFLALDRDVMYIICSCTASKVGRLFVFSMDLSSTVVSENVVHHWLAGFRLPPIKSPTCKRSNPK